MAQYLDGIPADQAGTLHGIVFAAACDFSMAAREVFRIRTRQLGFAEAYLWGKGELEDMLYQPKNDDVLFTFFGISRSIRQHSLGLPGMSGRELADEAVRRRPKLKVL